MTEHNKGPHGTDGVTGGNGLAPKEEVIAQATVFVATPLGTAMKSAYQDFKVSVAGGPSPLSPAYHPDHDDAAYDVGHEVGLRDGALKGPHAVTKQFEQALCAYTGAGYAVAVNSCTSALLLAVAWHLRDRPLGDRQAVQIPQRTYVSVPMSIIHAGGWPTFRDEEWEGAYQLQPYPIWDSARWFTTNLFPTLTKGNGGFVCASFHASKTLGIEQGGAILHDSDAADQWLRRARFDGRTEGVAPIEDDFQQIGWHCYLSPSVAAQGLLRLHSLPKHNAPLPNDNYPDLSTLPCFQGDPE